MSSVRAWALMRPAARRRSGASTDFCSLRRTPRRRTSRCSSWTRHCSARGSCRSRHGARHARSSAGTQSSRRPSGPAAASSRPWTTSCCGAPCGARPRSRWAACWRPRSCWSSVRTSASPRSCGQPPQSWATSSRSSAADRRACSGARSRTAPWPWCRSAAGASARRPCVPASSASRTLPTAGLRPRPSDPRPSSSACSSSRSSGLAARASPRSSGPHPHGGSAPGCWRSWLAASARSAGRARTTAAS
mmetsp:Transcript_83709/g.237260  ORF Transcript_83709/g.237260 Transcript_83709/m.237260 type:complete len:248 (-) Transcript_83709:61-804(-)